GKTAVGAARAGGARFVTAAANYAASRRQVRRTSRRGREDIEASIVRAVEEGIGRAIANLSTNPAFNLGPSAPAAAADTHVVQMGNAAEVDALFEATFGED